jgi:putative protease
MNPDPHFTPELLAPAGNQECLVAAIENGADAVYFGLDHGFNARARAGNFSMEELPGVMQKLHRHGLCGYVTLNTLVFSHELPAMAETVARVAEAGVDAVLVQDLGVARMVKSIAPNLSIHASTQMTLTCAEGIAAVQDLGLDRVVLPRELSLSEIQKIGQTSSMPLEVFVHGALCVAYSGQWRTVCPGLSPALRTDL